MRTVKMRGFILMLITLAGPSLAHSPVLVFPAVGTPYAVTVSGRVFKAAPTQGSSTLSKNLRRMLAANWEGAQVEVRMHGQALKTVSVHDGNFEVTFVSKEGFPLGITRAEAKAAGLPPGGASVAIADLKAPFMVISDFDDTLAHTHVISKRALIDSALLKDETSQKVVEGMSDFMGCLAADKEARPPFALVSGSPLQYVPRVEAFLGRHRFPLFGLYLRDLGPSTLSGYKQPVIRSLLKAMPFDVVLIGDSGEHDPEVYAQIRSEFPDRVKAIFIRDAGRAEVAERFKEMTLFRTPAEAAAVAEQSKLMTPGCYAKAQAGTGAAR
jgi:phosphatidate phosphatase APP1